MSAEYFYGATRMSAPKRPDKLTRPAELRGTPVTGRISKIMTGQGHGFVRLSNDRDVYFHRADLKDGTAFNTLAVGDVVMFELFEDRVSGARAVQMTRRRSTR